MYTPPPPPSASPHHDARARRGLRNCALVLSLLIFLLFEKIIARVIFYQRFPVFSDRGLLLTRTWTAPHVLPDRLYKKLRRKP
jgi:hypothetical protein